VRHVEAPGGKCRTQNRVQPTASDSSDSLFFIRKLRCEGTHFGVKLSEALLRGVRRYAPCTSAQDRAACGKINGFEPTFWGDFGLFWPSKKGACFHALNTGRCPRLHLCCGVSPLIKPRKNSAARAETGVFCTPGPQPLRRCLVGGETLQL